MMKLVDQTKKDVHPLKVSTPKVLVERNKLSGDSKNTPVANHPEKENTSPTALKETQNGTLPYPVYNIKKSRANITYFDLPKLMQQRDLILKVMNEWNCKPPTIPSSQTQKSVSRPVSTPSTTQKQ